MLESSIKVTEMKRLVTGTSLSSDCESQSGLQSASMNLQTSEQMIIEKEQNAVIGLLDKDLNRPK